jgi:FMN phosphatase YigB (HAD superfamily)
MHLNGSRPLSASLRGQGAVIFDLDDTLVDTMELLITPLEMTASHEIAAIPGIQWSQPELLELLLTLRRENPATMVAEIERRFPNHAVEIQEIRQRVARNLDVSPLMISDVTRHVVEEIGKGRRTVLLTEGDPARQCEKIRHLGLENLFHDIIIVDTSDLQTNKREELVRYFNRTGLAASQAIIVGNRLDREIDAGLAVGSRTIWLRWGEGSSQSPRTTVRPDAIIDHITDLPNAIRSLKPPV